ncbi:unnamed protein product [marine sediment metagenome]|uniref:Uncharacterized protein n=1 Tax=marine sediment metagenome TaxID=412755 RepID=X1Q1Y6_9ZZZZ
MNMRKGLDVSKIHPEIDRRLSVIDAVLRENGFVPELCNADPGNPADCESWADVAISWDDFTMNEVAEFKESLESKLGPDFSVEVEPDCIVVCYLFDSD